MRNLIPLTLIAFLTASGGGDSKTNAAAEFEDLIGPYRWGVIVDIGTATDAMSTGGLALIPTGSTSGSTCNVKRGLGLREDSSQAVEERSSQRLVRVGPR